MISFTFHFSTFGSARVSLRHLSNKSAPLRLFNKHFAPSDECAALLKCLFSFCLGGQPTVVYLTVNKQAQSLQLRASSPQWSLAEWHFSGGEKQTSSRFLFKLLSLTQVCAHLVGKWARLVRGERETGCSAQVGVFRLITDHYQLLSVCLWEEAKASLSHFKLTMTGIHWQHHVPCFDKCILVGGFFAQHRDGTAVLWRCSITKTWWWTGRKYIYLRTALNSILTIYTLLDFSVKETSDFWLHFKNKYCILDTFFFKTHYFKVSCWFHPS